MKDAFRYDLSRAHQIEIGISPYCKGPCGSKNRHWTCHHAAADRGANRSGRTGAGTHGLARTTFIKTDFEGVLIERAKKRHVRAFGKMRVRLDLGAQFAP